MTYILAYIIGIITGFIITVIAISLGGGILGGKEK